MGFRDNNQESLESVINKYNRLCARYRDLEQQSTEKQEKWKELEREFKIAESLTRELCELILAKDPNEMVLGEEYSWGKLSTREIIQRSKTVFANYNESRTQLLRDVQQQSEQRRIEIENLKIQIEQDAHARERLAKLQSQRAEEDAEAPSVRYDAETGEVLDETPSEEKTPSIEVDNKALGRMPYHMQQAAERGDVALVTFDDSEEETASEPAKMSAPPITEEDIGRGSASTGSTSQGKKKQKPKKNTPPATEKLIVVEEAKDVSEADIEQQADVAARGEELLVRNSAASIIPSEKKTTAVSERKKERTMTTMQVDIAAIDKRITTRGWLLIEIVGSFGLCEGSDIIAKAIELSQERNPGSPATNSAFRYELMTLSSAGCFFADNSVAHPMKSRFVVYSLSDIGNYLYTSHFGKQPVVSERDVLIAQHDNLEHGFGIKCLKNIIENSGAYHDISMDRSENTVRLQDGTFYIADIVAKSKAKNGRSFTAYFEYERGTHHQSDFSVKLNKAIRVTKFVDIVCPNATTVDVVKGKVSKWIESRGGAKGLPNVRIRITTLYRLDGKKNINQDDNWQVVFNLKFGDTPIER